MLAQVVHTSFYLLLQRQREISRDFCRAGRQMPLACSTTRAESARHFRDSVSTGHANAPRDNCNRLTSEVEGTRTRSSTSPRLFRDGETKERPRPNCGNGRYASHPPLRLVSRQTYVKRTKLPVSCIHIRQYEYICRFLNGVSLRPRSGRPILPSLRLCSSIKT